MHFYGKIWINLERFHSQRSKKVEILKFLICDSDVYVNPCLNVCYELQLKGNWVLVIEWAKLEQFESLSSCVILVSNVRYILGVYKSIFLVLVSW
jgi:hypothetical protein